MPQLPPNQFYNIDNRRVLDNSGRQGIDAVTGLGSSTEVLCGRLLEDLYQNQAVLTKDDLNAYLEELYKVRYAILQRGSDVYSLRERFRLDSAQLTSCLQRLYQSAPWLAAFQVDDLIGWTFQLRDGFPRPTTRNFDDER